MNRRKKSKEERNKEREIVGLYHQKVTEKALDSLYENFQKWKSGKLPYYELTERIHEFQKLNQKIWSRFNFDDNVDFILFQAKRELNLLNEEDKEKNKFWLEDFD